MAQAVMNYALVYKLQKKTHKEVINMRKFTNQEIAEIRRNIDNLKIYVTVQKNVKVV